jgi:predicted phage terminase large subunit-like protein
VVNSYPQRSNKESRIYSNRAKVNRNIVFPEDWATRWPEFYAAVTRFKKKFKANKTDDAPDTLTMIVEKSEEGFRIEDIEIDND